VIQYYEIPSIDVTVRKAVMDGIIQRVLNESGCNPRDVMSSRALTRCRVLTVKRRSST